MPTKAERPADCKQDTKCPNMQVVFQGWDSETWKCDLCGRRFKLYYEDMK